MSSLVEETCSEKRRRVLAFSNSGRGLEMGSGYVGGGEGQWEIDFLEKMETVIMN